MAFDEALAERIRECLASRAGISEKKMFGGLCFLVDGKMLAGIVGDDLMIRVGKDEYAAALLRPHAREMDFTGRPMTSMVYVGPDGVAEDADLADWLALGYACADASIPSKAKRTGTTSRTRP